MSPAHKIMSKGTRMYPAVLCGYFIPITAEETGRKRDRVEDSERVVSINR